MFGPSCSGWIGKAPVNAVPEILADLQDVVFPNDFQLAIDVVAEGVLPRLGLEVKCPFTNGGAAWTKTTRRDWIPLGDPFGGARLVPARKGARPAGLSWTGYFRQQNGGILLGLQRNQPHKAVHRRGRHIGQSLHRPLFWPTQLVTLSKK